MENKRFGADIDQNGNFIKRDLEGNRWKQLDIHNGNLVFDNPTLADYRAQRRLHVKTFKRG